MTPEQALQNLAQACRSFKGTWEEHMALQESLSILHKSHDELMEMKGGSKKPQELSAVK